MPNSKKTRQRLILRSDLNDGTEIVIPSAGLGTGLAKLPDIAPRTFKYLKCRLAGLEMAS